MKTQTAKIIETGIRDGTFKNLVKCEKCGSYHRRDYDCQPMVETRKKISHNE